MGVVPTAKYICGYNDAKTLLVYSSRVLWVEVLSSTTLSCVRCLVMYLEMRFPILISVGGTA